MTDRELLAIIEKGEAAQLPTAMLWHGEEEYVKAGALARLSARLIPEGLGAMNQNELEENAPVDEIIAACETLPMMAEARVVVVRDPAVICAARPREADADRLSEYLPKVPRGALLILYCRGKADARRKAYKAVAALDGVVAFDRVDEAHAARWLIRRAKDDGGIAEPAAAAMVARVGCDLTALSGELEKVLAFAAGREATEADVAALVPMSLEGSVFALIDAVLEGRADQAWSLLTEQVRMGESRVAALSLLGRAIRQAYEARQCLGSGASEQQVGKALGVSVYAARHVVRRALARDIDWWRKAVLAVLAAEDDIKSGRAREEFAVDGLVAWLMGAARA